MKLPLIDFGLDYLRLKFAPREEIPLFETWLAGLSANSNQKRLNFLGLPVRVDLVSSEKIRRVNLYDGDRPLLQLSSYRYTEYYDTKQSYRLDFYGGFFSAENFEQQLPAFLNQLAKRHRFDITRADIALDLACTTLDVRIPKHTQYKRGSTIKENLTTGEYGTRYLGSKEKHNKKHFIRIYNKLEDVSNKEKYYDLRKFAKYPAVTRIEAEIRTASCKTFHLNHRNIFSAEKLQSVFSSLLINPQGTYFPQLKNIFQEVPLIRTTQPATDSECLDKLRTAKYFLAYAKSLVDMGFDPHLLLWEEVS